jgi:uncharacterized protein YrrD
MVRLGELINRPVVSRDVGTKLGHVADLLVDGDRIIGIVLAGGMLASNRCCRSVMSTSWVRIL